MKIGNRQVGKDGDKLDDEKRKELDPWKDVEPDPAPPPAKDGGPNMVGYLGRPEPLPKASPDNFVCLRGPCRHYIEIHSFAEVESRGLDRAPRQINRICKVIPGVELDLTDDCVFECSEWVPMDPMDIANREHARQRYLAPRKKEKK
jgi:hypothetical protein